MSPNKETPAGEANSSSISSSLEKEETKCENSPRTDQMNDANISPKAEISKEDRLEEARKQIEEKISLQKKQLWDDAQAMIMAENTDQETGKPTFESVSMVTQDQNERMHKLTGIASLTEDPTSRKDTIVNAQE
jgi:hypothetical protein